MPTADKFTKEEALFIIEVLNAEDIPAYVIDAPTVRVVAWLIEQWGLLEQTNADDPEVQDGAVESLDGESLSPCFTGGFSRPRHSADWLDCHPIPGWTKEETQTLLETWCSGDTAV